LEQWDAQCPLQNRPQSGVRYPNGFFPVTPSQVRMHHPALDRTGTDDRYFDHQIVKMLRTQSRQHSHLRATLDLEHPYRIGFADHAVNDRILWRDARSNVESIEGFVCVGTQQAFCEDQLQSFADG